MPPQWLLPRSYERTDECDRLDEGPHYFGPYPNWANSPQVLSNAVVAITGGGGTGATADAIVDPKTGGVTGYTVTNSGTGYTSVPSVSISAPGSLPAATGATATAVIASGVLTSIAVVEAGFGFTTPSVAISGGGLGAGATAEASGGIDDLNIGALGGGSGYLIQPIVHFSRPDAAYCSAAPAPAVACVVPTATATMTTGGVVDSVTIVTPGSGYITAPSVDIWDGPAVNATPANVVATIGIGQIDVTAGGRRLYDSHRLWSRSQTA